MTKDVEEISLEDADKMLKDPNFSLDSKEPEEVVEEIEEEASDVEDSSTEEDSPQGETPVEEDWKATLPEDVRAKVEEQLARVAQLEHRIKSDDGRVAAFQKKSDMIQAELNRLKSKPVEQPAETPSTPEEWKKVIEHDPVLAEAVEALFRSESQKREDKLRQEFKETISPFQQDKEMARIAQEKYLLQQAIPEYESIMHSDMFRGWLENEASPAMKNAALYSTDHRDSIDVLNAFAVTMINTGRVSPPEVSQSQRQPNVINEDRASSIAANRERKLANTPVGSKSPAPKPKVDLKGPLTAEDADALIAELFKKDHQA